MARSNVVLTSFREVQTKAAKTIRTARASV
jgi:hypothetical protein